VTAALLASNIVTYALQIGALTIVAAIVPLLLKLEQPKTKLLYWQTVLLACFLLPGIRPWNRPMASGNVQVTTTIAIVAPRHVPAQFPFTSSELLLMALCAGILVRGIWLCIGFRCLRRYRRHSHPLSPVSSWGTEADLRISNEVASPVTFGILRPVVLLPANFPALDAAVQEAILCHEILHVRRNDWLFTLAEEAVRAVFWFHPAIWWLLGEIQLAREQAVDREVVEMTECRDRYVDALLAIAGAPARLDLAPAPLFLRKRHLKRRVFSILKEVKMSKTRTVSALVAGMGVLGAACWFVAGALPLEGAPQTVADAPGIAVELNGAQLMHRTSIAYPGSAAAKGIQGTVVVQVRLDASGNVADANILSGPEELRKPVLESVLNWHFTKDAALSTRQVSVAFDSKSAQSPPRGGIMGGIIGGLPTLAPAAPGQSTALQPTTLRSIVIVGLPEQQKADLMARLGENGIREGQQAVALEGVHSIIQAIDEHLTMSIRRSAPGQFDLYISTPEAGRVSSALPPPPPPPPPSIATSPSSGPNPIRLGGNVAQANLIEKTTPAYPALAKEARVQGTVRFEATIGKDGRVANLHLLSGHPLLIQSATEAVQQWVYRPTLLNGNPVEVITTVDVNYTLSE
jgi:TonB family protein